MRKTIIAGNWKMYKTIGEAIELANGLKRQLFELDADTVEAVLCPPFIALADVAETLEESAIGLGGQNVHWQPEGAFTGEISCAMLKSAGCGYCIIGHSERRQYFGETNETVNRKLLALLQNDLTPIVCVGETLAEREKDRTEAVLTDHVTNGLKGLDRQTASRLVIAYEPVWAIGTGKTATPQQAQEAHRFIRALLAKLFGEEAASEIRIQYGGSVKPENITELMSQPDVDGALVGGASLTVASFASIVTKAAAVKK